MQATYTELVRELKERDFSKFRGFSKWIPSRRINRSSAHVAKFIFKQIQLNRIKHETYDDQHGSVEFRGGGELESITPLVDDDLVVRFDSDLDLKNFKFHFEINTIDQQLIYYLFIYFPIVVYSILMKQ